MPLAGSQMSPGARQVPNRHKKLCPSNDSFLFLLLHPLRLLFFFLVDLFILSSSTSYPPSLRPQPASNSSSAASQPAAFPFATATNPALVTYARFRLTVSVDLMML